MMLLSSSPPLLLCIFSQFSFLVGTDTYQDLKKGKWRKSEELLKIVDIVVVDRECVFFFFCLGVFNIVICSDLRHEWCFSYLFILIYKCQI